jgi:general stress protein 26
MTDIKDISGNAAIEKITELVKETDICMFCTNLSQAQMSTRPMSTQSVDKDGTIWFFSDRNSHKDTEIKADNRVQLLYADTSKQHYLSLFGRAEELKDQAKIEELWTPIVKTWFQGGKDDPSLMLIKFTPEDGYYWDTKHNKMVAFAKMLASVVVGREMDDSVEGQVKP